jgi:hypothetical protein
VNEASRVEAGIRPPDRRLRVFVSSTVGEAGELAAERRAVVRAISALRLTPVLFEAGARPYPPRALYRAYLAQSDVFVGLYWQRYGRVEPGMEVSGLEEELQLALSEGLPRLLYVIPEGAGGGQWVLCNRPLGVRPFLCWRWGPSARWRVNCGGPAAPRGQTTPGPLKG